MDLPADDLLDPIGGVVAVELSRRFVRLCLSWSEPMVADMAKQETMLRRRGGIELAERVLSQRLYQRIDPQVFRLLQASVPLAHAEFALCQLEEMLRAKFGDVVRTVMSYLLSDDRDTAIQMGGGCEHHVQRCSSPSKRRARDLRRGCVSDAALWLRSWNRMTVDWWPLGIVTRDRLPYLFPLHQRVAQ